MELTFADTHNMITFLTKSDASKVFDQIIDFLNVSTIQYTLTVNPNIYVSVIKQFWSSVAVKKVNDVTRLQALVDRKKVLISEETVREALRMDDAESIDCLPNEKIFTELARMGYEKPSTKLTFYKAFFLSQWKFLIHTILQCMSAKSTIWNEFSSSMASAVICLLTVAQQAGEGAAEINVDVVPASVNVDDVSAASSSYSNPSPIAQPPSPPQQQQPLHDTGILMDLLQTLLDTCTDLTRRVENLKQNKIAHVLEITKLKQKVKKLEMSNKLKVSKLRRFKKVGTAQRVETSDDTVMDDVSKQGEIIAHTDADKDVTQKDVVSVEKDDEVKQDADVQGRLADAARRRKGVVIKDPKKTATSSTIIHTEPKSKDKGKRIMVHKPKPLKKKTQIEQDKAYTKEKMEEEHSRALKRKVESSEDKAAKKHKLDEEVKELRKHLQIVPNDDDYVYTEATPLALKMTRSKSKLMGLAVEDDKVELAASKIGCLMLKHSFLYLGSKVGGLMSRSMPKYHMSIFKVPMSVLKILESIRGSFFNGHDINSKKTSWVKWKNVLASKEKGGLGVSSLYALNRGLMFK
uniref:RNA-directed DNA polymerase, eukaryota, reverse transcriptase zinc-binding domain protein n=1 Tax=Tanacetum cinerariifolium TaxID=118510 RepID=A0A6L2J202_TANCI|nr:RNA-directed DNA polymerase, eukaryota, reverse transcriptase zinc-binding domain protein [Tanacetum cinerariifolium]